MSENSGRTDSKQYNLSVAILAYLRPLFACFDLKKYAQAKELLDESTVLYITFLTPKDQCGAGGQP